MKRFYQNILLYSIIFSVFSACGLKTSDKINANDVNRQIKERKIKRIKEPEIAKRAYVLGQELAKTIKVEDCSSYDLKLLPDSTSNFINKIWVECQQPTDMIEQQVWDAYKYNMEHQLDLDDNIQRKKEGGRVVSYLYSYPKVVNDSLKLLQIELNHKALVLSLY
ncbi:hypothetical protein [Flammeovirga sp. SubArs3]|uniref:hypothetical protein n=1 Tax=Flammeovirga sp. SubArs3 TaxID=2995316 RepID=UPI00248ADC12|nr:hypothetical protein [Flammeovirga sp. SubArs3]